MCVSKIIATEISVTLMQLYLTFLYVFKLLWPEDDPLWMKHIGEINTTENTDVLMALYSFIWFTVAKQSAVTFSGM
jgi:hypothetical protein